MIAAVDVRAASERAACTILARPWYFTFTVADASLPAVAAGELAQKGISTLRR